MRGALLLTLLAVAVMAWFSLSWTADADTKSVRERFETGSASGGPGLSADEKKKAVVSDIMDMYKELYGKYPPTEYLVHYRDLAPSLTREELRSRIKSDDGKPPGVKAPDQAVEKEIAELKPPTPGDKPILPESMKATGAMPGATTGATADPALPVRIMNIAMQLSALSEELQAAQRKGATPKAFESFISFRA